MPSISGAFGVANYDQITTEGAGKSKIGIEKKCEQCNKNFPREKGVKLQEEHAKGFHIYRVVFPTVCEEDKLHLLHTECLYKKVKNCEGREFWMYGKKIGRCDEVRKTLGDLIKVDQTYHSVLKLVMKHRTIEVEYGCLAEFQRKTDALRKLTNHGEGLKKLYMEAGLILANAYLDKCQSEEGVDKAIEIFHQVKELGGMDDSDISGGIEKARSKKCEWLVKKAQSDAVMLLEDCFATVEVIRRDYPGNSVIACCQAELHLLRAKFALDALGDRSGRLSVLESAHVFFDELSSDREKFKKALEALSEKKCQELVSIAEQRAGNNMSKFFVLLEKLRAYYPKNGNIYSCLGKIAKQHMVEIEELLTDPEEIDPDVLKEAFDSIGFCRKYGGKGQTFKRKVQDLTGLYLYPPSGKFDAVLKAVRRELHSVRPDSGQLVKLCAWFDTIEKQGLHGQKKALERLQPRVNMLLK